MFHIVPWPDNFTWWTIPWIITVIATGLMAAGLVFYMFENTDELRSKLKRWLAM